MSDIKQNATKTRSWRWPVIVVALLTAHVVGMVSAVTLISRRTRTLGVVDNYYEQAVRWDERQKVMRQSAELGWQVKIEAAGEVDEFGQRVVTFVVTDRNGKPVNDVSLDVTCVHPAHADVPAHETLAASATGEFAPKLAMKYEGFYDFSITAKAGDKTFVTNVTQWVNGDGTRRRAM